MTLRQVVEEELQAAYERGLKDGAAAEREECAKFCEKIKCDLEKAEWKTAVSLMEGVVNTIRARGSRES